MKKVGREVLFQAVGGNTPRNGEGAFIRLNDGRIMYAYTKFSGDQWYDHCHADIVALFSSDEGETWGDERVIVGPREGAQNHMCPDFARTEDGGIALVFGEKKDVSRCSTHYCVNSYDEGETWTEPVPCNSDFTRYYVRENDHMLKLADGRLILPMNEHPLSYNDAGEPSIGSHAKAFFVTSDDNGKSWTDLCQPFDLPHPEISRTGLQETTLYQRRDGSLRAFSRTDLLCQYECTSTDGGATWTAPKPNPFFSSPESPLLLKRVGDLIVGIFNPIPKYTTRYVDDKGRPSTASTRTNLWGRTPFIMAVSRNDGVTFDEAYYLEDDQTEGYCYPAIFDGGDYILVAYYHTNGSKVPLSSAKMIKIMLSELTDE